MQQSAWLAGAALVAEQKSADRSCELLRFVQAGSGSAATVAPVRRRGGARATGAPSAS